MTQVETEQKESQEKCDRLQQSLADLQTNLHRVTNKLSELAPLITKLEQYEQIKSNLEQCDREIAKLPLDLSQQVKIQEKNHQKLVEIKNTLPWLKDIVESKLSLADAIQIQTNANDKLQSSETKLTENKQQEQIISIDVKKLEQAERDLSNKLNLEKANYQRFKKQLQSFEKASTKPTCELCGQEITPEHTRQEKQRLKQNLEKIEVKINSLQHEYSTVKKNLSEKRTKLESIQNKLEDTQQRYHQIEQNKLQAERNSNLYQTLSELLGKKGIQLHILRNTEKAIIEIANEILDSLSRGNIRLELRVENGQTDKALDLIAYNYATGEKPTAVALTSGSQRFRIAVSLALAIGQYVGNNTRNIESVIIDEGFGSLDKNGRDDMIQELNELQQRLKRIILVSHQEEFFSAFANGYKIELIERSSKVSLI